MGSAGQDYVLIIGTGQDKISLKATGREKKG